MSSLAAIRNTARSAVVNAAMRMAPRAAAGASRQAAPALWARSFASGGFLPKEEVSSRVLDVVKNFQNVDPAKVTATSHFINDLGLDSLDTVEVRSPRPQERPSRPRQPPAHNSPPPRTCACRWRRLHCTPSPALQTGGIASSRAMSRHGPRLYRPGKVAQDTERKCQ